MKHFPLFCLFLFACTNPSKNETVPKKIDYQGHRGARGLFPENTIPGFIKALDYPIQTLEMDVVVSRDSQLIVSHEPWFSEIICAYPDGQPITADADKILLYQLDYQDIRKYDCGSRPHSRFPDQQKTVIAKPTLMDAISNVELHCQKQKRPAPFYNIELKSQPEWYGKMVPPPAEFVQLALNEIALLNIKSRTILQSFDPGILNEVHRQDPSIKTSFLVENIDGHETNLARLNFKPDIYSPYFKLLNVGNIKALHDQNILVIPWTINDPVIMKKLVEIGVDGIITDYPDRI